MEWRPASGRRRPDAVEFELLDEDDEGVATSSDGGGAGAAAGGVPSAAAPPAIQPSVLTVAARRTWAWLRARSPLQLVAAGLVVALAVTSGIVAGQRREQERLARIAAAPGGVADLSRPVRELWAADFPGPPAASWGFPGSILTLLDDDVLVIAEPVGIVRQEPAEVEGWITLPDGTTSIVRPGDLTDVVEHTGWDLHGLDLDTGEVRWTRPHPEPAMRCQRTLQAWWSGGGSARLSFDRGERLACVVGEGAQAVVRVTRPDGGLSEWAPDGLLEHTRLEFGPDGLLWLADRVDDVAAETNGSPAPHEDNPPADLRLRAVDPSSGEQRWSTVVPADPGTGSCTAWQDGGGERDDRRLLNVWPQGDLDAVVLWGCGIDQAVSMDGEPLGTGSDAWRDHGWRLHDGGSVRFATYAEHGMVTGQAVVDDNGEVLRVGHGEVLEPWTTDGRGGIDLRTPADERDGTGHLFWAEGPEVLAIDAQGQEVWRVGVDERVRSAIARVDDVVVLHTTWTVERGPHLLALDQRTGEVRWDVPLAAEQGGVGDTAETIGGAWTDGTFLVVVTPGQFAGPDSDVTWTAYDVRTGAVAWQEVVHQPGWSRPTCFTVAGRLLCQERGRISRLA